MNQFDFYYVSAFSSSKLALKRLVSQLGVNSNIDTKVDWKGKFPTKTHKVSIKYFDCNIGHANASKQASEYLISLPQVDGVKYHLSFIPVD